MLPYEKSSVRMDQTRTSTLYAGTAYQEQQEKQKKKERK